MKTLDERIKEMRGKLGPDWRSPLEIVRITQAAAIAVFGIGKESFFSGERTRDVTFARMASMAICREQTKLSLKQIAKAHGVEDHSCVLYARKKVRTKKQGFIEGYTAIKKLIYETTADLPTPQPVSRER